MMSGPSGPLICVFRGSAGRRDTPGITVLRTTFSEGAYWDSPNGRLGSLLALVKAKLGDAEDSGEHGDVAL